MGLAVAMGIGRFAFTPLLPLMQREGLLDAGGGAWLAAANYLGYLLGALSAARLGVSTRRGVLLGLAATALLTAATGSTQGLVAWMVLRLLAGMASAWVLVGLSGWAVGELARRGRPELAGIVFAGVGLGITAAGLWVWVGAAAGAAGLWWQLGLLAALIALGVLRLWPPEATPQRTPAGAPAATPAGAVPRGSWAPVLCYGALGFGYILPATYLPLLARQLIDDPQLFGAVWPVFGLAAAASTLLAARVLRHWQGLQLWAACHAVMALGCVLPVFSRSGPAVALAAVFVGGTFLVATMTGLQHARSLAPAHPTPLLGRMTAAFALGQIAGPLVALALDHLLRRLPASGWTGIELTLALAAALLLRSAHWLRRAARRPETPHARPSPP